MKPGTLQKIMHIEINFCSAFSNAAPTAFGKIFWNENNPLSWDSNHAVITHTDIDYEDAVVQIQEFYSSKNLTPRIYFSFHPEEAEILKLLKQKNWTIDDVGFTFYIHSKEKPLSHSKSVRFVDIESYTDDIREVVLSDPREGIWMVNAIKTGLANKEINVTGLDHENRLIGLYALHNSNGITRIDNVFIHLAHRGKGFGKQLVQYMIQNHYKKYPGELLYLCATNPVAKSIYERYGFEKITLPGSSWNAYKPYQAISK